MGEQKQENLFLKINEAEDHESASDLEKKHIPAIECPDSVRKGEAFNITVHVGKLLKHPNENSHFIQWIELRADDLFIGKAELTPTVTEPKVTFSAMLWEDHEIQALERCNLHGIWKHTKKIRVE